MKEPEMQIIAEFILDVLKHPQEDGRIAAVAAKVATLSAKFPLVAGI
jgi:glycine/serine hydroxymethyltransferase